MEIYRILPDDLKRMVLRYIPPSPSAQLIKDFREDFRKSFKTVNEKGEISGTSLKGYITTTKKDLEKIFGKPMCKEMDMSKSHFEWVIKIKDGTIATIYDYAQHASPSLAKETLENEPYGWHIGGKNKFAFILIAFLVSTYTTYPKNFFE